MLAADRDALACDLWETYQVRDMEALPVRDLAMLSCGLRENSRIRMKMGGHDCDFDTILVAGCYDMINRVRRILTGETGEMPSMVRILMGEGSKKESNILSFSTASEWEAERKRLLARAGVI